MTGSARSTCYAGLPAILAALLVVVPVCPADAQSRPSPAADPLGAPWSRIPVAPGGPVDMRPFPPKAGRNRCITMAGMAGAQMFGDSALELTMKDGRRYRLFFARECPALSFYQGFYYRRQKAGQLCAGRDAIGARSGGECQIASIIPVRRIKR